MEYPTDGIGDVLRAMAADGVDLVSARVVDFEHLFPTKEAAFAFQSEAQSNAQEVIVFRPSDEIPEWGVQCRKRLVPTHEAIASAIRAFDELARRYGGRADGWGSLSAPDGSPAE